MALFKARELPSYIIYVSSNITLSDEYLELSKTKVKIRFPKIDES